MAKEVREGQRIYVDPLNHLVKKDREATFKIGKPFPDIKQAGVWCLAVNKSDDDLRFGDVASIIYDNATPIRNTPTQTAAVGTTLKVRTAIDGDAGNFVICAEAIPVNQSGWVYTSGIILARLQDPIGSGDEFNFCDVDLSDGGIPAVLKMQADGSARVLDVIGESNEADVSWAYVKFPVQNLEGSIENPYLVGRDAYEGGEIINDEEADDGSWDRDAPKPIEQEGEETNGLQLTIQTRAAYFDAGDQILYGYFRDLVFDSNGLLVTVSGETRTIIDTPEDCA